MSHNVIFQATNGSLIISLVCTGKSLPDQAQSILDIADKAATEGVSPDPLLRQATPVAYDYDLASLDHYWETAWAWDSDTESVFVDWGKAVAFTQARLREESAPLVAANDTLLRDLLLDGNTEDLPAAKVERDRLRAIPNLANLVTVGNLDGLKNLSAI